MFQIVIFHKRKTEREKERRKRKKIFGDSSIKYEVN